MPVTLISMELVCGLTLFVLAQQKAADCLCGKAASGGASDGNPTERLCFPNPNDDVLDLGYG